MKIALITTGFTEYLGLADALSSLFPGHEFASIDDVPGRPFHGFTSCVLPAPKVAGLPSAVDKIVARAVNLVDPKSEDPLDLVIIVDDLEVANRHQPSIVVDEVRNAVKSHITGLKLPQQGQAALSAEVAAKLSFHLLVPMVESWFFADPSSLTALCVGAVAYHLKPGDPEQFESTDAAYISASDAACTMWCSHKKPKKNRPKWVGAKQDRVFHPKGYLQWLLMDAVHHTCTSYREGKYGAAPVLKSIDWNTLLSKPGQMPYAKAMVEDIAQALGQVPSASTAQSQSAPLTRVGHALGTGSLVLRNI